MINKKAEFRVPKFVIGLLAFFAVFGLFFLYIADLSNGYSTYGGVNIIDNNMNNTYNKFDNTTSDIAKSYDEIKSSDGIGFDSAGIILKSAWNVLTIVFRMPIQFHDMLLNSINDFGIPSIVGNILLTFLYSIILILIVFAIINYLSRGGSKI
jgi:hypothetical protein